MGKALPRQPPDESQRVKTDWRLVEARWEKKFTVYNYQYLLVAFAENSVI